MRARRVGTMAAGATDSGATNSAVTTRPWRRAARRGRLLAGAGLTTVLVAACSSASSPAQSSDSGASGGATGPSLASHFPSAWSVYGGNPEHNSAFESTGGAPAPLDKGVSWKFAEQNAIPLDGPAKDQSVLGARGAPVKTTQFLGNSVGVTVVNGVVYAESDTNNLYALDAVTGKQLWVKTVDNALMGNPVLAGNVVVVGSGDTGFSFEQVMAYAKKQPVVRGLGWSAVYGFDAKTGQQLWRVPTLGEAMASLACRGQVCFEGTGDGKMLAINAQTGTVTWTAKLGGFDSMSSINIDNNVVLAGFTDPNFLYAINADTGAVLWKQTVAGVANTGMGDNSPTVDSQSHVVFQNSIVDGDPATKTVDSEVFATDIATGALSWQTKLGRGPNPPAYKAGVGMVHNGVLYLGSPNTSIFHALDEKTGKEMWAFHIPGAGPAGAGRGAAAFYHGVVWLAAGPSLYALDPKTGSVLGKNTPGGRFGIVNPVIVGSTMYLGNSWGWIQAVPLDTIYSGWRNQT